jgi:predicted AlkP superfamily pyrophosphatase or phosphodiesterase
LRGAVVVTCSLLAGCAGSSSITAPTPTPPPPSPKVVVISVDGLRPDAITELVAPNIHALAQRGARALDAQTVMPSNTLPAHVSMLSGYAPSVHKVAWDDYMPERGGIQVSTVFAAAKAAGLRSVLVAGKEKFNHFRDTGTVDTCIVAGRGDEDVANEGIVQTAAAWDLMFVHFGGVDLVGHSRGWMSAAYIVQVNNTDRSVGRLLAALPRQATVILTADHGGHGAGHGTSMAVDMTIPWLIAGPGIPEGLLLTRRIQTTDTAATVAHLLSIRLPPDVAGKPVLEAFQPGSIAAQAAR